ncbi:hypothetical protein [Aquimarina sp. AU58]|uniref:hypothetical protein n=1 Tax=Aquimarina sp. AU58 TaxID=1874112 RepID=UPI000D6DDD0E|nr:hypothetical protein [Aquimarina sp. AU58]
MKQFNIILKKRKVKFILHLIVGLFLTLILSVITPGIIEEPSWFAAIFGGAMLIVYIILLKRVIEYFTYGEVKLILESDGNTIKFYNITGKGKIFNRTEEFDLSKIKRFYIVKKNTRYFMKNYAYAFEEGESKLSSFFKVDINVFPSLFEATPNDRNAVLDFLKEISPEIELGYENIYQKLTKK